jgi:DNA-binding MarR family transcriptional regulator
MDEAALGRLDQLVGFHLRMASAVLARDFARVVGKTALTQMQFAVLELVRSNRDISQSRIAKTLGADRATMMAVVARLQSSGFITRVTSRTDRRTYALELTARGGKALDLAYRRIKDGEKHFTVALGSAHIRSVLKILREICELEPPLK